MGKLNALLFSNDAKVEMLSDMVELLGEGMSVREIAEDFQRYGKGAVSVLGSRMLEAVSQGKTVSSAFVGYFNDITVQTILAGENSQDLKGGCINAQQAIKNTGGVVGMVIKAVLGPLVQLVAICAVIIALSGQIFPILADLIPLYMWPSVSRSFYSFVQSISDNVYYILGSIILMPYLLGLFMRHYAGPGRDIIDKLPGFTQYRYIVSAQVMYTMASILRAGGSLYESLEFAERGVGRYQSKKVAWSKLKLQNAHSASVGDLLDIDLLNERELNRLKVMASSSRGNAIRLQRCAESHSRILLSQMEFLSKFLRTIALASSVLMLIGMLAAILMLVMQARTAMTM